MSDTANTPEVPVERAEDALTELETEAFEYLLFSAREQPGTLMLVRTKNKAGKNVALICVTEPGPDGTINSYPIAQIVTNNEFDDYMPPEGSTAVTDDEPAK